MRILKSAIVAGCMFALAAPAFAGSHKAGTVQPGASAVSKKKSDKKDMKCDAMGKACTEGEDCKPTNCKPSEPAPQR